MERLPAYISRVALFHYVAHLIFWIVSSSLNATGSNSTPLFWAFFFVQNLFSFLYFLDIKKREREGNIPLPYTLLHAVCAPYGFFGAVLAMHALPCPVNSNGFVYKIPFWTATNYIFYSHFWCRKIAWFYTVVVFPSTVLVFVAALIAQLYERYLKRQRFLFHRFWNVFLYKDMFL